MPHGHIEYIAVKQPGATVGQVEHQLIIEPKLAQLKAGKFAQQLVVVAGQVMNFGTLGGQASQVAHHLGIRQRCRQRIEIVADEIAEDETLGLQSRSRADHALFLGKGETTEALVEARDLAAGVEQSAAAAGPCRVRGRVDLERQRVAFLAPRRAGLVGRAVGHLDGDEVIVGVSPGFHDCFSLDWLVSDQPGSFGAQPSWGHGEHETVAPLAEGHRFDKSERLTGRYRLS